MLRCLLAGLALVVIVALFAAGFRTGRAWSLAHDEAEPCTYPTLVRGP